MWNDGFQILQNIQDIFNLKNTKRTKYKLTSSTTFRSKKNNDFMDKEDNDEDFVIPDKILQMTNQTSNDSEEDIDILMTKLRKERGKDKPGCQKKNLVVLKINDSSLFSCDEKDFLSTETKESENEKTEKYIKHHEQIPRTEKI